MPPTDRLKRSLRIAALLLCGSLAGVVGLGGCGGDRDRGSPPPAARTSSVRSDVRQGPVHVAVRLEPAEAKLSDLLTLTVRLEWEPGVSLPEIGLRPLEAECRIRQTWSSLPRREGAHYVAEQTVLLEPLQPGQLTLAPLPIAFCDRRNGHDERQVVQTEPLQAVIGTVIDAPDLSLSQLHSLASGIGPPARDPVDVSWLLGLTAAGAGVGLLVWRRRRERQRTRLERSPERLAELELEDLLRADLIEEDVKRFYAELSGVVRRYLERRYRVHARQQTTEEFVRAVAEMEAFSPDQATLLEAFLTTADRVKFAGARPSAEEGERSLTQARVLLGQHPEEAPV